MDLQFPFELVHKLERCAHVPEIRLKAILRRINGLDSDGVSCKAEWSVLNSDNFVAVGKNSQVLRETVCSMRFTGLDNTKVLLYKIIYREKQASKQMRFMWILNSPSYCLLPMLFLPRAPA
jgi:hypothetical protein